MTSSKLWIILHRGERYSVADTEVSAKRYKTGGFTHRKATAEDNRWLEETYWPNRRDFAVPSFWPASDDFEHFCHPDPSDTSKVRYLDHRNKYVSCKPGRYITKYFPDLNAAEYSARWGSWFEPLEVLFAHTEDEIETVYVDGPDSCMSYTADYFESRMHPVRVYAAGDLAVAYAKRENEVTARTLVWPSKKIFGRIYGDEVRLTEALEKLGYKHDQRGFYGARLLRRTDDDNFIVPYVDYFGGADDDGDYLRIGHGDIDIQTTNGLSSIPDQGEWCEYYEDYRHEETRSVRVREADDTVQYWSESARDNNATYCPYIRSYFADDIGIYVQDELWSPWRAKEHAFYCDYSHQYWPNDQMLVTADGKLIAEEHFKNLEAEDRPELEPELEQAA